MRKIVCFAILMSLLLTGCISVPSGRLVYNDDGKLVYETGESETADAKADVPTDSVEEPLTETPVSDCADMKVYILDVGQGDCTIFECDGHYMMIDGGDRDHSSKVISRMKELGIAKLDICIATHYDADHLNGVVGALNNFPCDLVICPTDYEAEDSRVYDSFKKLREGFRVSFSPDPGTEYSLGDAVVTIIGPTENYELENDKSIAVKVTHAGHAFLWCGDAQKEEESGLATGSVSLKADVLHVNHHGSGGSNTADFLKKVGAKVAVVSCGEGNDYGHPHQSVLDRLREAGTTILYRTDKQGEIVLTSTVKNIYSSVQPTDDWSCGVMWTAEEGAVVRDFVLNVSSKKFHSPECEAVSSISERNRENYTGTLDELKQKGYSACGQCKGGVE